MHDDGHENGNGIPGGYILLARSLRGSAVWERGDRHVKLWLYLLLAARWKEEPLRRGNVTIRRGQVLKSLGTIAEENEYTENRRVMSWSKSTISRMLSWFEDQGMISTLRTELGTLITIRNFSDYQDPGRYRSELGTGLRTPREDLERDREPPERAQDARDTKTFEHRGGELGTGLRTTPNHKKKEEEEKEKEKEEKEKEAAPPSEAGASSGPDSGEPSGGDVLALWIERLPKRPPDSVIKKQGVAAKRLAGEYTQGEILEAMDGIGGLYPHSDGQPWDLFDLERKFANALNKARAPTDSGQEGGLGRWWENMEIR